MNNIRRKRLQKIIDSIEDLKTEFEFIKDEEVESFENIPENLQGSERYERAEEAVDNLDSAFDSLEEAISYIEDAIEA